jgi:hypothetical protein
VIATVAGLHLLDRRAAGPLAEARISAVHSDDDALWVLAAGRDLYRVARGGPEPIASLGDGAVGSCIGTHRGEVWVGGDEAGLWRLRNDRFEAVESFHEAPTRAEWGTPWGGPPAVFSIASDGSELYVSVHVGGILRSSDGESWTPTIDLHDDVHQVAVGPDGTLWAATGRRGLAESNDRGVTWRYHVDGLHARYALAVAAVTDGALLTVSSGHAARDGAVYRFDRQHLSRVSGLPDQLGGAVGPRQLAAAGEQAVVALPDRDVYVSHDGGRQWTRQASSPAAVSEVALHTVDTEVA